MIETERLLLRTWKRRDRAPFAAMNADPTVMDFSNPLSRRESDAELDGFIERWRTDGFSFAAAERRRDGAFVGMVGLARCHLDPPLDACVEIGWRLARRHWGQGYATEAARGWLDHGFGALGLAEIVAFTDAGHARSQAVMRRLGMSRDPARDFDWPGLPEGDPLRAQLVFAVAAADWAETLRV